MTSSTTFEEQDGVDVSFTPSTNRMIIAILSLIGIILSSYLMLHRLGFIGSLACGTGSCETVQTSPWATFFGVPVPLIGIIGYIAIFAAAFVGIQERFADDRRVALALIVLALGAFAFSAYLTAIEAFRIHAWCRYCVVSAIMVTIIFLLTIPEYRRARAHEGSSNA